MRFARQAVSPKMDTGNAQEHVFTTDFRTLDKAKAYARQHRRALRRPSSICGSSCGPVG